jgi:hypothetical protein
MNAQVVQLIQIPGLPLGTGVASYGVCMRGNTEMMRWSMGQAVTLYKGHDDYQLTTMNDLGDAECGLGHITESMAVFKKLYEQSMATSLVLEAARALMNHGRVLCSAKKLTAAESDFKRARILFDRATPTKDGARSLAVLANVVAVRDRHKAEALFAMAAKQFHQTGDEAQASGAKEMLHQLLTGTTPSPDLVCSCRCPDFARVPQS